MSKVTAYYHIVFCTKLRKNTIPALYKEDLYRYIYSVITKRNCDLIRIGGIQNHIHILLNLHPSISLSAIMQDIKSLSSGWMSSDDRFPDFRGWAAGYYGSTLTPSHKSGVIEYIKNQEQHHLGVDIDAELQTMCRYADLEYDERDLR